MLWNQRRYKLPRPILFQPTCCSLFRLWFPIRMVAPREKEKPIGRRTEDSCRPISQEPRSSCTGRLSLRSIVHNPALGEVQFGKTGECGFCLFSGSSMQETRCRAQSEHGDQGMGSFINPQRKRFVPNRNTNGRQVSMGRGGEKIQRRHLSKSQKSPCRNPLARVDRLRPTLPQERESDDLTPAVRIPP
ncbi:hypothetical protein VTK73DRAFT_7452 [Phialemonium thermophilum]|uniref:Uncharacterized protein n=1 Tax=Phialemonium thermophilum TaxID=223376 RepID=A0ABR3WEJ7_9PEZI